MKYLRFLTLFLLCLLILTAQRAAAESNTPYWTESFPNGAAAGDVTQDSVVIWTRVASTGTVTFSVVGGSSIVRSVTDPTEPVSVRFTGLDPARRYLYTVSDRHGNITAGTFVTPAEEGHHGLRFGASGDWRGDLAPYPAIANMASRNLDFFLALGDTIYADVGSAAVPGSAVTLAEFRRKHAEVYSAHHGSNNWAAARSTTALYATFDDHEVRDNFAGGAPADGDDRFPEIGGLINETSLYRKGMQSFLEYNPVEHLTYAAEGGDGRMDYRPQIYRYRTFGNDAALFVLDARSFRDAPIDTAESLDDIPRFLEDAFASDRTMLGLRQLEQLESDLLDAESRGIVWKFIAIPEPIQHLGFGNATDRFEGYAYERTRLTRFLINHHIDNVVFITGDLHGTVVNNVMHQEGPDAPAMMTTAFEVSTGPVAHEGTVAARVMNTARRYDFVTDAEVSAYQSMTTVAAKDRFIRDTINAIHAVLGYDPVGLNDSPVRATLVKGQYVAAHVFGWTEYEIDEDTLELTVTTYGVDTYNRSDVQSDPDGVISLSLSIISQFKVEPLPRRAHVVYLPVAFFGEDD